MSSYMDHSGDDGEVDDAANADVGQGASQVQAVQTIAKQSIGMKHKM